MGRVQIPVARVTRSGIGGSAFVQGDDQNKMYFANNAGNTWLLAVNDDAADAYVGAEFATPQLDTVPTPDRLATVPAGGSAWIGTFPRMWYNQDDNSVWINPGTGPAHPSVPTWVNLWFKAFDFQDI